MEKEVISFYSSLRQIFGVCPCCEEIFRVSDCKLYQKTKQKPTVDWKEKIDSELARLENLEDKILEKIEFAREKAREVGRKAADKQVQKIDKIFKPLKLNPNDAKVIFHPVDFIVFNGMNNNHANSEVKNLLFLDKKNKTGDYVGVQKSIEQNVNKGNYEWLTLRIEPNGTITEE